MNDQARQQILDAGVELLKGVEKTAKAQHKLLRVRNDREASAEDVYDASQAYRATEAEAQQALSQLLELHVQILDEEFGKAEPLPTMPENWR